VFQLKDDLKKQLDLPCLADQIHVFLVEMTGFFRTMVELGTIHPMTSPLSQHGVTTDSTLYVEYTQTEDDEPNLVSAWFERYEAVPVVAEKYMCGSVGV